MRGISAQRYNASGQAVSRDGTTLGADEFTLNTNTAGNQEMVSVAGLSSGGFVAVWQSDATAGDPDEGISGQIFDASGNAVGGEFKVNANTSSTQQTPTVTALRQAVSWSPGSLPMRRRAIRQKVFP